MTVAAETKMAAPWTVGTNLHMKAPKDQDRRVRAMKVKGMETEHMAKSATFKLSRSMFEEVIILRSERMQMMMAKFEMTPEIMSPK